MKVKALVDCVGVGYNLKKGDSTDLDNKLALKLIQFDYVEEEKVKSKPKETKVK